LTVSLDGSPPREIRVDAPGAYELSSHDRHQSHHLMLSASPGVAVYAIAFAAGVPPAG